MVGQPPDEDLGEGGVLLHGVHGAGIHPAPRRRAADPRATRRKRSPSPSRRRERSGGCVPGAYSRLMAALCPGSAGGAAPSRRCR